MVIFKSPKDLSDKLKIEFCESIDDTYNLEENWYRFLERASTWPITHIWRPADGKYPFDKDKETYWYCVETGEDGKRYYRDWGPQDIIS